MKFRSCQINPEQVRLLLFKECDWRGRKLLFDSSAIQKVPAGKDGKPDVRQTENVPSVVEVSDGFHYLYKGPAADASVLGEMIFGAVAMNYKSVSLKIHIMDEPKRLMCTKVFSVPSTRRVSQAERRNTERPETSSNNLGNRSTPLSVPSLREEGVSLSFSLDRGDSGYYGDLSPYSSVGSTCDYFSMFDTWDGNSSQEDFYSFHSPPGRKLSTSSNGSWQRRTFQNFATRFELGHQSTNLLHVPTAGTATSCDSQMRTNSSASTNESVSSSSSTMPRKNKLGLALLITVTDTAEMDLVRRCVEHSPQLQALVCRLRLVTLAAGARGCFVSTLYKGTEDAARWLTDLIYGPRLQPMWLNLVTSEPSASSKMAVSLLSDLCTVLSVGDTKATNFFISTLLTHVLTYHLGWVTTVSPYDTVDYEKQPKPERPYNALWAQLGDLCGAIGHPPRVARTVISGTADAQFLNRLLLVLTYFVRCGDVRRQDFNHNIETVVESVHVPECKSRTNSCESKVTVDSDSVSAVNTRVVSDNSASPFASQATIRKSDTLANLCEKLSSSELFESRERPTSTLRRNPTLMLSLKASSDSSINSSLSDDSEVEQKVVFVLGDNDRLVGLKNKSNGGKSVKKSSKVQIEPYVSENKEGFPNEGRDQVRSPESPSKCCGQTLQHSKPIKHSGFKFEFDKYPQIVTNYMKSKNLEILDRHYIGKPGNLKLDNFQFDPTIVPAIQEERCETCVKCQLMESMLQTPTNASEMEYMNDMPRQSEPQYALETIVQDPDRHREMSPKTFVRRRKENTVVVNVKESKPSVEARRKISVEKERDKMVEVKQVLQFPVPQLSSVSQTAHVSSGFDASLLGGITDHYVPDMILQGTLARPSVWEMDLRRDLDLTSHLNKTQESPIQAVAILGDTNTWEVRVVGRECGSGGMSSLVGAMLDALPAMWRAKVPAHHCLSFLEGKLREFCVLSKTLAEMLMSTDFCDIATLTKSLNIDVNDVPLLLAIATTHTPQVATRYGISYR